MRQTPRQTVLLWTLGLAIGCGGNDLSPSWQLDRLRVLAVRADPAEPRPGETTVLSSYVYWPEGVVPSMTLWFACLPDSATDFGCTLDPAVQEQLASVDLESATPEELAALLASAQAAGLIGAEPFLSPQWTPDPSALDDLDAAAQLEGLSAVVNISAMPEGAGAESDLELAFKRIPVSLASTPNHNPDIVGWRIAGTDYRVSEDEIAIVADRGETWEVEPILSSDSVEDYVFVDSEGADEVRIEQPYFTFYSEGGAFDQPFSLFEPDLPESAQVRWTAPEAPMSGRIVAVARDRRGGMAWAEVPVTVR